MIEYLTSELPINTPGEYRALVENCGLAARIDRSLVVVSGERAPEMLNGLLTNQVAGLSRTGRHAMLLSPKGRVLTDLRVFPRRGEMLLDVPQGGLGNLLAAFRKYLPPVYASFHDASAESGQLGLYGPAAVGAAEEVVGGAVPAEHLGVGEVEIALAGDGPETPVLVIRNRRLAGDGVELIAPVAAVRRLVERLLDAARARGGGAVGVSALEIVRVESGLPAYGIDISEENLAQETGLEDEAISYEKGCYLGQEVVARVHFRGHVNRLLRGLRFEDDGPAPGAVLRDGAKAVGRVTSSVSSPALGPIGLGYVRRELGPGAALRWSAEGREGEAEVIDLPFRRASV